MQPCKGVWERGQLGSNDIFQPTWVILRCVVFNCCWFADRTMKTFAQIIFLLITPSFTKIDWTNQIPDIMGPLLLHSLVLSINRQTASITTKSSLIRWYPSIQSLRWWMSSTFNPWRLFLSRLMKFELRNMHWALKEISLKFLFDLTGTARNFDYLNSKIQ